MDAQLGERLVPLDGEGGLLVLARADGREDGAQVVRLVPLRLRKKDGRELARPRRRLLPDAVPGADGRQSRGAAQLPGAGAVDRRQPAAAAAQQLRDLLAGERPVRRAAGDRARVLALLKAFPLAVTGTLGFDYAQATRGGIPLSETDGALMSVFRRGLYFAGEILNVDGACGGFNLHWAWASAHHICEAIR